MDVQNYLAKMKAIQDGLLTFIQKEDNFQDNYLNFDQLFEHYNIRDNRYELETVLYILSKITDNHHRMSDFFRKIEHILYIFKNEIKKNFSNMQIFNIFKSNKEILRFLLEEKILLIDNSIAYIMTNGEFKEENYPQYFYKELEQFIDPNLAQKISKELPENFVEKRKEGIEEDHLCNIIINDSINDFINYTKSNSLVLSLPVKLSIFETHSFLINKNTSVIEYAAFCGSFQIFDYLYKNQAEITPSLWLYAIHGRNLDIIKLLEQNKIKPKDETYEEILTEAVKCHHENLVDHILENYFKQEKNHSEKVFADSLKYYNFHYIESNMINKSLFYNLCEYGYYPLVQFLLKTTNIDINARSIFIFCF